MSGFMVLLERAAALNGLSYERNIDYASIGLEQSIAKR